MRTRARVAWLFTIALFAALAAPTYALADGMSPVPVRETLPANVEAPKLTGTPVVGQTLSCSAGSWSGNPTSFSYTWLRSGAPIPGQASSSYVVQSIDIGHTISCEVTASNGGGTYTVGGLPTGSYAVSFYPEYEGPNYLGEYYNGKSQSSEANAVSVTSPATTGGINAELHAGGQISGTVVRAATKAPIGFADVCATGETAGKVEVDECALTAANGTYTISKLPKASYVVYFEGPYPESPEDQYESQYYGGKTNIVEAQLVVVNEGNDTAGVDAELQSRDVNGRIKGKVRSGGSPLSGIEVCAYVGNYEYFQYYESCATTGATGEYELTGLVEAGYTVYFSSTNCMSGTCKQQNYVDEYYEGSLSSAGAKTVNVSLSKPSESEKIDAELTEGGHIAGVVTKAAGGAAIAGDEVCAYGSESADDSVIDCEETNGNGEYTLQALLAGGYQVEFYSTEDDLYQYYNNQPEGAANTVTVTKAGATTPSIDAKLVEGGQITGQVISASTHAPVGSAEVCAETGGIDYSCRDTNSNGEYALKGLVKATYEVVADDYEDNTNYLPNSVGGVAVTEGSVASGVEVELHPGGEVAGIVTDAATHDGIGQVDVCAEPVGGSGVGKCALTTVGGGSAGATSPVLTVAGSTFTQAKSPKFDAKTGDLDFFFNFPTAGKLSWKLSFRNADVGFADSLGISLGAGDSVFAEVAKKKGKAKAKKCKKTQTKHRGKCVATLVSFASGSQNVAAGTVEVKVHAGSKALKALKSGHTLHVSGTFTFQPATGGPAVAHTVSAVVHPVKKVAKGKARGKGKKG